MDDVARLPSRRIADDLRASLEQRGSVTASVEQLPIPVDEWRRLARAAARSLGRPVRTMLVGGVDVTAVLADWPATSDEHERHRAAMRAAIDRLPAI